jgi:protein tyrosine/serine phosphatase
MNRHTAGLLLLFAVAGFPASVPGIGNFDQVDEHVYRGAQPTEEGLRNLAKLGVKTVLDLREEGARSLKESQFVAALGMRYVTVPMGGLAAPTAAQISTILALLQNDASVPVFVHCKRGADRTGAVIASYRIEHDHWDNARALKEALAHGMSWFQIPRQNYIRTFQPRTEASVLVPSAVAAHP